MECPECSSTQVSRFCFAQIGTGATSALKCKLDTSNGLLKRISSNFTPRISYKCDACDTIFNIKSLELADNAKECSECNSCVFNVEALVDKEDTIILKGSCNSCGDSLKSSFKIRDRSVSEKLNDKTSMFF